MEAPADEEELKSAIAEEIDADPVNFYERNPAQARFIEAISNPPADRLTIVPFLKGNGVGGSWSLVMAWSAIMFGTQNPAFQGSPFGKAWPFRKSARLVSTIDSLSDKGSLQFAMRHLFPAGKWFQSRGAGKSYFSEGETETGWMWDCKTYDQTALQAAGANKGLILFSEPPPKPLFTECCTRLRGCGLILIEMTQLDMASYIEDIVKKRGLWLDGKKVGEVRVVRGDIEENCRDHHPPDPKDPTKPCGQRSHASIEADIALWPAEEREARRTGKSLRLSGLIYPAWSDANELDNLPEYHQECWDKGQIVISTSMDPHDRKPWFKGWFATFPNNDVVAIAEWPPFDFSEAKSSPINDIEDYRAMILETEEAIGYPIQKGGRIGDPRFIMAPKSGTGETVSQMLARPCRECLKNYKREEVFNKCTHRLFYRPAPDSARINHAVVRSWIGDATKGIRPKFYALKSCPNLIFAHQNYAYKEEKNPEKALSEGPQYVHKDGADVVRYLFNAKLHLYPEKVEALDLYKSPYRDRNAR